MFSDGIHKFQVSETLDVSVVQDFLYVSVYVKDKTRSLFRRTTEIYNGKEYDDYHRGYFLAEEIFNRELTGQEVLLYDTSNYSIFDVICNALKYDAYGVINSLSNMQYFTYDEQVKVYYAMLRYLKLDIDVKVHLDKSLGDMHPVDMLLDKQRFYEQSLKELQQEYPTRSIVF